MNADFFPSSSATSYACSLIAVLCTEWICIVQTHSSCMAVLRVISNVRPHLNSLHLASTDHLFNVLLLLLFIFLLLNSTQLSLSYIYSHCGTNTLAHTQTHLFANDLLFPFGFWNAVTAQNEERIK